MRTFKALAILRANMDYLPPSFELDSWDALRKLGNYRETVAEMEIRDLVVEPIPQAAV